MTRDDELDRLAQVANNEHHAFEATQAAALAHAIAAGKALIEAKSKVSHGQWLPWLAGNFEASERTAHYYMRIARNPQRVADLDSVRSALAKLADPRRTNPNADLWKRWVRVNSPLRLEPGHGGRYEPFPRDPKMLRREIINCRRRLRKLQTLLASSEIERVE